MKERKRSANMTDEEYMEWGGLVFGPCHLCAYCGDGKELNDLGWCYQHERLVKPLWGCCEIDAVSPDDYWITRNEAYNEALWKTWVESFDKYLKTRLTIIPADKEEE